MLNKYLKYLLCNVAARWCVAVLLPVTTLTVAAQNSVLAPNDSARTQAQGAHEVVGFSDVDATTFQVQGRYRNTANDTAFQHQWWRRFSVGVSSGYDLLSNMHASNGQVPVNFFLGYRITPVHQLRLQGGFEQIEIEGSQRKVKAFTGELQWLDDLSSFSAGYNPKRPFGVSTLVGVGIRQNQDDVLPFKYAPYGRIGLDLSLRIGPNISFFMQPYVGVTRNHQALFKTKDPALYNIMYGAHAGLAARLDDSRDYYANMAPSLQSFFFEASTGWGFNIKGFNAAQSGSNEWIGLGRWFDPVFGLRLGAMGQENYWSNSPFEGTKHYSERNHHVMLAGRLELMLNLRNLSPRNRLSTDDPKWEVDLTAGGLYGYNAKNNVPETNGTWRCYYYGFTTAMPVSMRVSEGSYIFFEPRFFNNYYQIPYVNKPYKHETEVDRFVAFSVGARVYAASPKQRRELNERDSLVDTGFQRNIWTGLGLGGMKIFETTRLKAKGFGSLQPSVSLSLGYDIHPLASVRVQADWQQLARFVGNVNTRYQLLDLRALYMLPFTNLIRGYHSGNKFHTYLELGPSVSFYVGQRSTSGAGELSGHSNPKYLVGQHTLGLMTGSLMAYDVSKRWDVYAEVQGQWNRTIGFTPIINNRPARFKWGLYGGVRYHFRSYSDEERMANNTDVPSWQRGWFVEGSTGWLFPLRGSRNNIRQAGTALGRSGALFNLNFGHWFTPWLGGRVGLRAQQHSSQAVDVEQNGRHNTVYQFSAGGAATVEVLTNPINWTRNGRGRENPWFDLNLSAGFQAGMHGMGDRGYAQEGDGVGAMMTSVMGFVSTAQALFRVAPGAWLYFEPRYSTLHYSTDKMVDAPYQRAVMRSVAFSAGMRLMRPYRPERNWTDSEEGGTATDGDAFSTFGPFTPHWWVGLLAGGGRDFVRLKFIGDNKNAKFQPSTSLSVGYDFTPLFSLRSQFEYTRLGSTNFETMQIVHNNQYNLRLISMLNMTNLWQNTSRWPRLSVYPELGVAWAHNDAPKYSQTKGTAKVRNAFGLMLGAMFAYRVTPAVDAVIETQEQYHWPYGFMPSQGERIRVGNGYWNLTLGARYHISPSLWQNTNWTIYKPEWQRGWFLDTGYGLNMPLATSQPLSHVWGNSWQASVGHWVSSIFGFRLGATGAMTKWGVKETPARVEPLTGEQLHAAYSTSSANWQVGGRAEILLNPLNFMANRRHGEAEPQFDLNLSSGVEFGYQSKAHTSEELHFARHSYVGWTAAAQFLCRVAPQVSIFVEPRFHTASYKFSDEALLAKQRVTDKYIDLSVGTRISRPTERTRTKLDGEERDTKSRHYAREFHPGWWAGFDVSGAKQLHCQHRYTEGLSIQPVFSLDGGYDLTPLSSVRVQCQYGRFSTIKPDLRYHVTSQSGVSHNYSGNFKQNMDVLNVRLMYMLNLTNLWQSTRRTPRLSVYWEVGPTFASKLSDKYHLMEGELPGGNNPAPVKDWDCKTFSAGVMTGIEVAYRVAAQWDVTIESTGQYNFSRPFLPVVGYPKASNVLMQFGLGTRYHF